MVFEINNELNEYMRQNDPLLIKKNASKLNGIQEESNFVLKNKVAFYNPPS